LLLSNRSPVGSQLCCSYSGYTVPVGWNLSPDRNVSEDETNENPRKKIFSRDTTNKEEG
jgi:hypothetical protein